MLEMLSTWMKFICLELQRGQEILYKKKEKIKQIRCIKREEIISTHKQRHTKNI